MAWTKTTQNREQTPYLVGESSTVVAMANSQVNSDNIVEDMGGKKQLVGINVTTAGSDVAATLIVQGSHNGTDWVTLATATEDTTPNVTGVKLALVDLTNIYTPFYRLAFNAGGLTTGTTGRFKFIYSCKG